METRTAIPRWLGFSWWWLLIASLAFGLASFRWPNEPFGILLPLWLSVQAGWLRSAAPGSRAVFYLVAGGAGQITEGLTTYLESHDPQFSAMLIVHDTAFVLELGGFAGVLLLAYELKRYLRRTEGYEPTVSYVWAFLLSVFYFQYKLHELFEDQLNAGSRLTLG